jgi:hypothetical protein
MHPSEALVCQNDGINEPLSSRKHFEKLQEIVGVELTQKTLCLRYRTLYVPVSFFISTIHHNLHGQTKP